MISRVESVANIGISAYSVRIETDVSYGLPQFIVVGLPDTTVKESRERVRTAIKNSGYDFPSDKITVNLAPADIKKEGPAFDLPIAIGILAANETISTQTLSDYVFLGELALDGSLRPIPSAIVLISSLETKKKFIIPEGNSLEASFNQNSEVYAFKNLGEVIRFLKNEEPCSPISREMFKKTLPSQDRESFIDFAEVKGQYMAKRAIEIAVAGGHNILMIGPPGSGKTMISKRITTILPPLNFEEALEITKIHSITDHSKTHESLITKPPFRAPHHSSSMVALIGGGSWPKPGEISLAHGGILFLDEFPEFRRDVLEALRGPLEDGEIHISRAKLQVTYPARMMLVAAMNPCPCGFLTAPQKTCRCSLAQIQKYQTKISGPILDRIDLHVEVSPVPLNHMLQERIEETSEIIQKKIITCRKKQAKRYQGRPFNLNASMRGRDIKKYASPDPEGRKFLESAIKGLHLSARAYYKILKVARTIADLAGEEKILPDHIAEAISYRSLDRKWGV